MAALTAYYKPVQTFPIQCFNIFVSLPLPPPLSISIYCMLHYNKTDDKNTRNSATQLHSISVYIFASLYLLWLTIYLSLIHYREKKKKVNK